MTRRRIKAMLHCHSAWSYDGDWPLEKIARVFGMMGYDAVMMTEHDGGFKEGQSCFDKVQFAEYRAACAEASTSKCTLIPGIEYSSPENDIHILTWGLTEFVGKHRPVMQTLKAVQDHDGVAVFAHPVRRDAWRQFSSDWVPYLAAIEIWNRKSDGLTFGREALRLCAETGLSATVGTDFHRRKQLYPLTNRFEIADNNLETELVAAIAQGRQTPCAFGKPVASANGNFRRDPHDRLEAVRKGVLKLLRG